MLAELFSGRALRPVGLSDEEGRDDEEPQSTTTGSVNRVATPSLLATPADDEPVAEQAEDEKIVEANEFSIASVSEYLRGSRAPLAIAISPTGDDGSAATVSLVRKLAEDGSRVILVDMTGSGLPTDLMAEDSKMLGITDLLCGDAAFGDTIHGDSRSDAHFIPQGISDPRRAMRGADRLSLLLDALISAYDLVMVECGAADVAGVSRLTQSKDVEIILSMPEIVEQEFVTVMTEFEAAGYERVVLMSDSSGSIENPVSRRAA
jgi:Mrp family chromosome partitioning ATPase